MNTTRNIDEIEKRFKEVTCLENLDLSIPHMPKSDNQQQKTTKEDYDNFSWVCTPIWLVDDMIEPQMGNLTLESKTCDACCGCGQFSVRLMRKLFNKYPNMDVCKWLKESHTFTEFQFSNVAKLVYVFGTDINVYAGDTLNLPYSTDSESGILFFDYKLKKWHNLDKLKDAIELHKDDLDALVGIFTKLEGCLMPKFEKKSKKSGLEKKAAITVGNKREKTVEKPIVAVSVKEQKTPKQNKPVVAEKVNSDFKKADVQVKPKANQKNKFEDRTEIVMKVGVAYKPSVDFDDF